MTNLKQLIEKSRKTPVLAHIYAMELDTQLRDMVKAPVTISANGLSNGSPETAKALGWDKLFDAQPTPHAGGTIYRAEMLAKTSNRIKAIAYAFANAQGAEINALNLFYATHSTRHPELRLYFINKYLAAYDLQIEQEEGGEQNFFHRIRSRQPTAKVDGPLVTIIMPAHNAEGTIELAVGSLLNQTWKNLQIIVVDDASTDGTLQKAKDLAKGDPRVEVLSSPVNVGPYVCRNLGVLHTRGQWLTVHDADDWAFPDRIEQEVQALTAASALACTGCMLRMNEQGEITRPIAGASTAEDGYLRKCFVSLMVQTAYFRNELGAWDSVRVGGDAELIERLKVLDVKIKHILRPLMICLDHVEGLTNHQIFGLRDETGKLQPLRADYKQAYTAWHKAAGPLKISAFGKARAFEAPLANQIDQGGIKKVFATWSQNLKLIKSSALFDTDWYRNQYPEAEELGLQAAEHYLVHGYTGANDPSPAFSSRFYLLSRSVKTNPLVHHLKGKDPGPNPKRVLLAAGEVAKTGAHERAIALAEAHLPHELTYTANILKANAAIAEGDEVGWQKHLNAYLAHFSVAPIRLDAGEGTVFDRLNTAPLSPVNDGPLVTVIMPAWNAEKTVRKAVNSILNQSWRNLELLIVDDASTDGTWTILNKIAESDARVKIFRNNLNVGPYVSKNIALSQSKGAWITGHDADDWAHPQRLVGQLGFCTKNNLLGCMSGMMRITTAGQFVRLNPIGGFVHDGACRSGLISLMIQGQYMREVLGGWDLVRTSGDSELLRRIEALESSKIQELKKFTMLCIDNPNGLTNDPIFCHNEVTGVSPIRAAYKKAYQEWHVGLDRTTAKVDLFENKRNFEAPKEICFNPTDVKSVVKKYESQGFKLRKAIKAEVVLITNMRFPGGNASSSLNELTWFKDMGLSYAVIHCPTDDDIGKPISERYIPHLDHYTNWSDIQSIETNILICRAPKVLTSKYFKKVIPLIKSEQTFIVKNNSSFRPDGSSVYKISDLIDAGLQIPSREVTFCPIGPLMRSELDAYARTSGRKFNLSVEDWFPTFDLQLYRANPKLVMKAPFRIGRHGRDGAEKWHEESRILKQVYPDRPDFNIIILGGARKVCKTLGHLPLNWRVYGFGEIEPHEYLANLDAFVYFPNSNLIEAFGRTIIEAMLAGVPVILPKRFYHTFGDLPLYCEPQQVADIVRRLAQNDCARLSYLTEIQQIAAARYSNSVISKRIVKKGMKYYSIEVEPKISAQSLKYRDELAGLL